MTTIAATIVSLLIDIARRIGRWVVRKLVRLGMKKGIPWMEKRIELFRRRRKRAASIGHMPRVRWLDGKIRRWLWALSQVRENQKMLEDKAVRTYCKATDTALAEVLWYSPAEKCPAEAA